MITLFSPVISMGLYSRRVLLHFACLLAILLPCRGTTTDISFTFMVSAPSPNGTILENTGGVEPAVDMALSAINTDPDILAGYRLTYNNIVLNSQCERSQALNKFVGDIRNAPPNKLFLLGSGCSIATEAVGEISHLWQIIDMSYASQSPLLSSRSQFPRFFRTVPSSIGVVNIITNFMKYYNWTQLNIINQLEPEFEQVTDELVRQAGLNVSVVNFHTYDNTDNVVIPKENNIGRIYFLNMYSSKARRILCHNYNSPLSYPLQYPYYVWLVHGWYQDKWWTNDVSGFDPDVNCTDSQFELMLNQSISLLNYPKPSEADMTPTDVNMTVREFYQDYRSRLSSTSLTESYAAPFAYDALWAMAFAINNSLPHIENISLFDNLREQSYPITSAIATNLTNLSPFSGISGNVSFDVNGTREQTQPRVGQYRFALNNDEFILIGNIVQLSSNDSRFVFINGQSNDTVWPIITPFDGTLQVQIETIFLPLSICIYIPGVAAIIFAIICALVNFIFRKRKVIRLTSPNLNYIIILGCILLEVSALLYSFPTTCGTVVHVMCIIRVFTQLFGYTLCFGTICAKMGRVYLIFSNITPKKRNAVKDWHLFLIVMCVILLDVIMGVLALALDRDYLPVPSPNEFGITQNEYGINVEHRSIVCDSSLGLVWIAIMFSTKFLIQVAALFFAIKTRKVKIKVLNDAKWIGIIIYITTVILTGLVIGAIALRTFINADAAVYSFCLIVGTTVVLLILFIPKWYHLYKDPHGEKIFERGNLPSFSSMTTASPNEHEIKLLNAHIEKLESRLGKYEAVTPYQSRRRVFSTPSSMENSTNNPRMAALRLQTPERSISPAVDVTASLPVGRLTPLSSPTGANGGGPQIKESSIESSEDDKGKNGQLSIVLEDEVESSQQELVKNVETSKVSFSNEISISPANI